MKLYISYNQRVTMKSGKVVFFLIKNAWIFKVILVWIKKINTSDYKNVPLYSFYCLFTSNIALERTFLYLVNADDKGYDIDYLLI